MPTAENTPLPNQSQVVRTAGGPEDVGGTGARLMPGVALTGTSTILPARCASPVAPAVGSQCAAHGPCAETAERTLIRLRKALRRERARGRSGHFSYDLARHLALAQQVRSAEAALRTGSARRQP